MTEHIDELRKYLLMYHDIKQRGYTFDSYLNVDSTAGWTLAEAVQRIETENIYVKLYADNLLHALSKVLIGENVDPR
jgi:hypothetical protein